MELRFCHIYLFCLFCKAIATVEMETAPLRDRSFHSSVCFMQKDEQLWLRQCLIDLFKVASLGKKYSVYTNASRSGCVYYKTLPFSRLPRNYGNLVNGLKVEVFVLCRELLNFWKVAKKKKESFVAEEPIDLRRFWDVASATILVPASTPLFPCFAFYEIKFRSWVSAQLVLCPSIYFCFLFANASSTICSG